MRTTAFAPPFPTDIGTWLAAFRHRITNARREPISPERLGKEIGVSGATIRRWEMNVFAPNLAQAERFAAACNLTELQTAFLCRTLRGGVTRPSFSAAAFHMKIRELLACEFPTYVMDSMLFIRGWNSYLPRFLGRSRERPAGDYHLIEFIIDADRRAGILPIQQERVRRAVMEFWFFSADACGSPEYRALVQRLSEYEVFRNEWARLAFLDESDCIEIGIPRRASRPDVGEALISPYAAVLPPIYYVRQFIPLDARAQSRLEELRREGPPSLLFDERIHWAHTVEDEERDSEAPDLVAAG